MSVQYIPADVALKVVKYVLGQPPRPCAALMCIGGYPVRIGNIRHRLGECLFEYFVTTGGVFGGTSASRSSGIIVKWKMQHSHTRSPGYF